MTGWAARRKSKTLATASSEERLCANHVSTQERVKKDVVWGKTDGGEIGPVGRYGK